MKIKQTVLGYTALDGTGSSAVLRFNLPVEIEPVDGHAAGVVLRSKLATLTACSIIRQSVVYPGVELAPGAAAASSIGSRAGVFIFSTDADDQYAVIALPGILPEFLVQTGPGAGVLVNLLDPNVQNLVAFLLSFGWCNRFGHRLIKLEAAFLQIRD